MSLHHNTGALKPQQTNVIPPGKIIYVDETFQIDPPKYVAGEAFPRQGKELILAHFSYAHHNPSFTPVNAPSLPMNYGTYIYNIVDGYQ